MSLTSFDPEKAFLDAFEDELSEYPPDTEWMSAGRPSKAHPHGEDADWWRESGPGFVRNWMEWREGNPGWELWVAPDGQLGVELALNLDIAGEPIKLFIDRVFDVDGRLIIVDLKSGGRNPEDADIQLGLYKVAVETAWPEVSIAGGAYWNARQGKLDEVASLAHFTPSYIATLARRVRSIRKVGAYLPSPGSLCRSCGVGRFCAVNNGRDSHLDPDFVLLGGNK